MSPGAIETPETPAVHQGRLDPAYLESLFQGAGFAIIACRPEGEIVAANAAAIRLFGAGRRTLGGHIRELFPEGDRAAVDHHLEQVQTTLEISELNVRLGGSDAEPIEYAVWFTPVLEPDGTLRGVSLWFRDITQRMGLARALEKRERLASLGSLSGAVAHHYNNLLCCIATSVEYAINMNTLSAMRRALTRTADAVGRAAGITQQLLAFAQGDHRSGDLADLTEMVLYFLDQNEERLAQRHVKLQFDWQLIPIIPVRRDQLIVILENLTNNAVEAMPAGGVLTVTLGRRDEDTISLSIADTGPGIDPRHMEHLFEPFFTTKGEFGEGAARNAGMGLAVVHGIVSEMHGTITAANIPGRGARFDIVLPIRPTTSGPAA
jgi:PAS domain S-box-containing protein